MATEPDYQLTENDVMMVDFGCIYQRCFSDTGTTLAMDQLLAPLIRRFDSIRFGRALPREQRKCGRV